ncbi:MAG: nuclear transport factor 2 family protein, partial [Acidobacteriota bacterium]|nr:nuclear transport factor 2 family protein [Acidobacteriota bacterium]
VIAAVLFTVAASTFAFGQCSDADKQKLEAWDKALGDAVQRSDQSFLQTAYADDYRGLSPSGVMLTKTQTIENALRDSEQAKTNPQAAPTNKYDYYDITCTPNTAVISHRVVTAIKQADGKERTQYARAIHFLERKGSNWAMVSTAGHPLGDAAQLIYMERDWNDASKRRDVAWFERNYADDATDINSRTGAIHTKAEEIADMRSSKATLDSLELSDMNVRVEGNTAVVTGVNHVKGRDEKGQVFERRTRFTDVFVKRDGRWQVLATQGTAVAPPADAPQTTTAQKK